MSFIEDPENNGGQPLNPNNNNSEPFIAKTAISKGQAVCHSETHGIGFVVLANSNDHSMKNDFAGIALSSVLANETVEVQTHGEFEDLTANWQVSDKEVYYDHLGNIVSTPPTTATHYQIIGRVLTNKKILIEKEPAVNA